MDIYNYEHKYKVAVQCVKKAPISGRNKELIVDFVNDSLLDGFSKPRLLKFLSSLKIIAETIKVDFDKATIKDIKAYNICFKVKPKTIFSWYSNSWGIS